MDFVFGVVGFAGFEALRIYKCLWAGHPVLPLNRKYFYVLVVGVVAVFSGALATVLAHGSVGGAIYVGFSVPTGIKALLDRPGTDRPGTPVHIEGKRRRKLDVTDDIIVGTPNIWRYLSNHYFAFR